MGSYKKMGEMEYQRQVLRNPDVIKLANKVFGNMSSNEIREFILTRESLKEPKRMNHEWRRIAVVENLLDDYKRQSPDMLRKLYAKTFNLKPLKLRSGNGKTIIKFIDSEPKTTKQ